MTSWYKVVSLGAYVGRTSCCQCSIFSPLCHWQIQRNDSSQEFDTSDIIWLIKTFLTIVLQLLVQSLIVNCRHYIPIMRVSKLYLLCFHCLSLMLLPFLIDDIAISHWHRCYFSLTSMQFLIFPPWNMIQKLLWLLERTTCSGLCWKNNVSMPEVKYFVML